MDSVRFTGTTVLPLKMPKAGPEDQELVNFRQQTARLVVNTLKNRAAFALSNVNARPIEVDGDYFVIVTAPDGSQQDAVDTDLHAYNKKNAKDDAVWSNDDAARAFIQKKVIGKITPNEVGSFHPRY